MNKLELAIIYILATIITAAIYELAEPNTWMISYTEDHAAIVRSFNNRGNCLVDLEQQAQTNYRLQCWTKPDNSAKSSK